MRISYDYDACLNIDTIYNHADDMIRKKHDVFIITSRNLGDYSEVRSDAMDLGIPRSRVIFTSGQSKKLACEDLQIDIHVDDCNSEVKHINNTSTITKAIRCSYNPNWKKELESWCRSVETVGAKIRNSIGPYHFLIQMAEIRDIDYAMNSFKDKFELHKQCCDKMVELSKQCEIRPNSNKYGG